MAITPREAANGADVVSSSHHAERAPLVGDADEESAAAEVGRKTVPGNVASRGQRKRAGLCRRWGIGPLYP